MTLGQCGFVVLLIVSSAWGLQAPACDRTSFQASGTNNALVMDTLFLTTIEPIILNDVYSHTYAFFDLTMRLCVQTDLTDWQCIGLDGWAPGKGPQTADACMQECCNRGAESCGIWQFSPSSSVGSSGEQGGCWLGDQHTRCVPYKGWTGGAVYTIRLLFNIIR
jgi:hypothetical protein